MDLADADLARAPAHEEAREPEQAAARDHERDGDEPYEDSVHVRKQRIRLLERHVEELAPNRIVGGETLPDVVDSSQARGEIAARDRDDRRPRPARRELVGERVAERDQRERLALDDADDLRTQLVIRPGVEHLADGLRRVRANRAARPPCDRARSFPARSALPHSAAELGAMSAARSRENTRPASTSNSSVSKKSKDTPCVCMRRDAPDPSRDRPTRPPPQLHDHGGELTAVTPRMAGERESSERSVSSSMSASRRLPSRETSTRSSEGALRCRSARFCRYMPVTAITRKLSRRELQRKQQAA